MAEGRFDWVEDAKQQLSMIADGDDTRRTATDEIDGMKPVSFTWGSMKNFHFEAANKDGDLILHLFPVDLEEGFVGGAEAFGKTLVEVYTDFLGGRVEKLEVDGVMEVTPAWIDPEECERKGIPLPAYPSICVKLLGYGLLEHTHKRLLDEALAAMDKVVEKCFG